MEIPSNVQDELEKRDQHILALEMLTVDQASRLLAVEAILAQTFDPDRVEMSRIQEHIESEANRFQKYFEGEGLSGFIERANRVAAGLMATKS